uniref:Uncharacterized protein n=1 Tax=Rhizophora mucronata TaxID=61149 RepID=A0A2P2K419_RHIMU
MDFLKTFFVKKLELGFLLKFQWLLSLSIYRDLLNHVLGLGLFECIFLSQFSLIL